MFRFIQAFAFIESLVIVQLKDTHVQDKVLCSNQTF